MMENQNEGRNPPSSSLWMKWGIVVVLIVLVGFVVFLKEDGERKEQGGEGAAAVEVPRPCLLDLGSDQCVPCKMMAPILETLKEEYEGILDVRFINTREDQAAVDLYGIRLIPTQIFYDAGGKELFRHEGFFSREDILAKWKELGFDLAKK